MPQVWRLLQVFDLIFLVIVVLLHIAEKLRTFPGMGWGLPNSIGHYLEPLGTAR